MQEIVHSIDRVTKLVGGIAIASREQSSGIDAVNQAVSQMDTATRQNAALAEEAAASAQTMAGEAQTLREGVSLFKVNGSVEPRSGAGSATRAIFLSERTGTASRVESQPAWAVTGN
jgi:methyl-accepting chemotaxis protein